MAKAKPRQRRKDDRPSEILQAAMDEFAENGFAGAKIEAIAERAGVAKGTVYLYYATKAELFEAIVRDRISPVFAQVSQMVDRWPGDTSSLLQTVIQTFYKQMIESDQRRMILKTLIAEGDRFGELTAFYHREVIVGARKMLAKIMERGLASGEFRDSAIVREPMVVIAPAMFAAVWKMTFEACEPLSSKRFLEAHIELVLSSLRAPVG